MTLTIDLDQEEEVSLRQRASQQGQPTDSVAAALLKQMLRTAAPSQKPQKQEAEEFSEMTDAEFSAYWGPYIGVIHGSPEPLSEDCGERFTAYLAEKKQHGFL